MKRLIALVLAAIMFAVPALAIETSIGLDIGINVEEFKPLIWLCDSRVVSDDYEEPWRATLGGDELYERMFNYIFEGEQIEWDVLVMDKNKIQEIKDVYVILASTEGSDVGDFVVECMPGEVDLDACNARIGEESIDEMNDQTMAGYHCLMTVESKAAMYGEYWANIVAESQEASGITETATIDEDEYWFFNPRVGISISDPITFNEVKNGVVSYSNTVLVENDADDDSGVHLEMFIGGQDYRPGAGEDGTCFNPVNDQMSNYLVLGDNDEDSDCGMPVEFNEQVGSEWDTFCYYAVNGAYSTADLNRADDEGYVGIPSITNEGGILDSYALLGDYDYGPYAGFDEMMGNVLGPGDEVSLTLKLMIPEPCTGSFGDGAILIYGEAI